MEDIYSEKKYLSVNIWFMKDIHSEKYLISKLKSIVMKILK